MIYLYLELPAWMKRSIKVLDTYARPKHTTQLENLQSSRYFESFSQPSSIPFQPCFFRCHRSHRLEPPLQRFDHWNCGMHLGLVLDPCWPSGWRWDGRCRMMGAWISPNLYAMYIHTWMQWASVWIDMNGGSNIALCHHLIIFDPPCTDLALWMRASSRTRSGSIYYITYCLRCTWQMTATNTNNAVIFIGSKNCSRRLTHNSRKLHKPGNAFCLTAFHTHADLRAAVIVTNEWL